MRRKNRVILLTLALTALLFAGCNSVEQENESQIFESEEIQQKIETYVSSIGINPVVLFE